MQGKYLSIELNRGRIQFEVDLGSGPMTLMTDGTYNSGEQTKVQVTLIRGAGSLRVTPLDG